MKAILEGLLCEVCHTPLPSEKETFGSVRQTLCAFCFFSEGEVRVLQRQRDALEKELETLRSKIFTMECEMHPIESRLMEVHRILNELHGTLRKMNGERREATKTATR